MKSRTPEEYRQWLAEETEKCLRQSNQTIDTAMASALDKAAQDYMAELDRLLVSKKTARDSPDG